MTKTFTQSIFAFIALFCLIALPLQAHAKPAKGKAEKAAPAVEKEKVILLPLVISAEAQNMSSEMQAAVVQGLQQKYLVYSGDRVSQELKKASEKQNHSAKHECDETRCLQDIATAFQTENVAVVHINKIEGGYLLSVSIKGVISNEAVFDNSLPCKGCDAFQVVDKLKELSGTVAPVASVAAPEEAQATTAKVNDAETDLWEEVKKSNMEDDYRAYLKQFPKGKYIALAKSRLGKIQAEAKAEKDKQEKQSWEDAQQGNEIESYQSYLTDFPNGKFAVLAQGRITKLQKEQTDVEAKQKREVAAAEATQRREQAAAEAKRKQEQIAEAAREKREAGKGPAMIRIPGKNYEIGKYDVTQKEWQAVMGSNPSEFTSCGDNCPVEQVSWNDVQEFLQKLNAKTGKQYRLPTEAEWEYACYGGSQTEYCGSNDINSVAWYSENSNKSTHPVGQKQANGYGLYDMSGNVWEWQSDCWEGDCAKRELRGGSWDSEPRLVRASNRDGDVVANRDDVIGFRLARTLP